MCACVCASARMHVCGVCVCVCVSMCLQLRVLLVMYVVDTLHSVPSSCTLCQPVLIVSTSDKKYRFGVPFKVLTKQVGLHTSSYITVFLYVHK